MDKLDQRYITKCCECPHFVKEVTTKKADDPEKKERWTAKGCKVVNENAIWVEKGGLLDLGVEGIGRDYLDGLTQKQTEALPTCHYRLVEIFTLRQVRTPLSWKEVPELKEKFEHR